VTGVQNDMDNLMWLIGRVSEAPGL